MVGKHGRRSAGQDKVTHNSRSERVRAIYNAPSRDELSRAYDAWAAQYDADVEALGYVNPMVALGLCTRYVRGDRPILDAGCGTGLMGQMLALLDYAEIDGLDMSMGMLRRAAGRGVYRRLHHAVLGERLPLPDAAYGGILAIGVFTTAYAGPEALDELLRITEPGGTLVFTVTQAMSEAGFQARQDALEAEGRWRLLEATPGFLSLPKEEAAPHTRAFAYRRL